MAYIGVSPSNGVRRVHTYTATASQTTFSGAGAEGTSLSYKDSNFVDVYQNGIKLGDADYTSTSGTSIVLAQGASVDDLVVVVVFDVFSVADTVSKADGGTFDGNVTMAGTLGVTGATTLTGGVSGNTTFSGEIITSTSGTSNVRIGENAGDAIASGGNYNTVVGDEAGTAITTGDNNVAVGFEAGNANVTGGNNTLIGRSAGTAVTADSNTFVGRSSGSQVTSGANNTIVGRFQGNSGGLDIRTGSNNVVLSDGEGNLAAYRTGSSGARTWNLIGDADSNVGFFLKNTTSVAPYGVNIQFPNAANNNGSQYFLVCTDSSGAGRLQILNNGNVINQNNSYGSTSDVKLKEQITDASSQWEDIKALKIRKYKMKEEVSAKGDSDDLWRLGVVAQELETAKMNGLVQENTDRDEDMKDLGTTTKSVKYSVLYMKAVKALQEAMARIETLEAKVIALENAE
jgi:hypothetical protein